MYQVLNSYRRFDQKNHMLFRMFWDPSQQHLVPLRWEAQWRKLDQRIAGFDLKDFALIASTTLLVSLFGTDIHTANTGLTSWDPLPVYPPVNFPKEKLVVNDAGSLTEQMKRVARFLGADIVGIAKFDMRWIYSHHYILETGESRPVEIDERFRYVIAMALEMDYNMIGTTPGDLQFAETMLKYSRMAFLVGCVAHFIRQLVS